MEKETFEEAAEKYFDYNIFCDGITDFEKEISIRSYIAGAKWQQERMFSEEEVKSAFRTGFSIGYGSDIYAIDVKDKICEEWFEQFKKK